MYKHVLVPVAVDHDRDTSAAFDIARQLAGAQGKVSAITVQEYVPLFTETYVPVDVTREIHQAVVDRFEEVVPDDIEEKHVLRGTAAQSILSHVEKNDVDCIVIASHRPGLADYMIGSTAARVVRHAKCSVHVIR